MLINVGMVTGLLPVVGIPLPFMSYGGSSMLVSMAALGLLLSVRMRQFQ
jgi:rod shape determining protein RodA